MPVTPTTTRRVFLKHSALVLTGAALARRVWGSSSRAANETLGIAVIGVAGQGLWNIEQLLQTDAAIVALCDVDERRTGEARTLCPNARFFVDFREMLDKAGKDIDAVLVATPDHTHAVATMAALQAGKHVYCEKPLTHSVWEARQVMSAARKYRRVTQMGIQMHAGRNYRRVVALIQAGAIGPVREVYAWCPRVWSGGRRPEPSPVPPGLHWDLWLGPAPQRPYAYKAYVPSAWRGWWDFGGGAHADMACHYMDLAHAALDLGHPSSIEAEGPPPDEDSAPKRLTVRYEYPAITRGGGTAATGGGRYERPGVKLAWSVGVKRPQSHSSERGPQEESTGGTPVPHTQQTTGETPVPHGEDTGWKPVPHGEDTGWKPVPHTARSTGWKPVPQGTPVPHTTPVPDRELADWKDGVLFVGDEGMLVADFHRHKVLASGHGGDAVIPSEQLPEPIGHHQEFVTACKAGGTTSCHFDYTGVLTQAVLLGNVAYRNGTRI